MEIVRLEGANMRDIAKRARDVLARGGIVLYPTDTIYGLAVDALNKPALARLRALKGREAKKPISVIVPEVADIESYADLHELGREFAARHLPGALTLVLSGKGHLPEELMLNGQIGMRIPDEPIARALARELGRPITATSANRSGIPTEATVDRILGQFAMLVGEIDLVIDAGPRDSKTPSTVIMFVDGVPRILREGALTRAELGI